MEYLSIIIILIIILAILYFIIDIKSKQIKEIAEDENLNKITNKFPESKEICKSILKRLNNESVKIEEDNETKTSLYLVLNNKIIIANNNNQFTRIQTIAHECIHSIQSKKMLIFNYIYSNIFLIYFATISLLTILKIIKAPMLQVEILTILGLVYYFIRQMLEDEAMIKARYLAKDYMESTNYCSKEEIEQIINGYDELNKLGIKGSHLNLLFGVIIKIIIYCIICFIMT